jgi:hypothetical protein
VRSPRRRSVRAVLLFAFVLAGCGTESNQSGTASQQNPPPQAGTDRPLGPSDTAAAQQAIDHLKMPTGFHREASCPAPPSVCFRSGAVLQPESKAEIEAFLMRFGVKDVRLSSLCDLPGEAGRTSRHTFCGGTATAGRYGVTITLVSGPSGTAALAGTKVTFNAARVTA